MKVLEFSDSELYKRFSSSQWVVQNRPGWFCVIGGDMKVKQTVQRVSKDRGGHYVVRATRDTNAVADFDFLFHEIGAITNVLNVLTTNYSMKHTECHLQHAPSPMRRLTLNLNMSKLLDFMLQRRNPYKVTVNVAVPLHNAPIKQTVERKDAVRLFQLQLRSKLTNSGLLLRTRRIGSCWFVIWWTTDPSLIQKTLLAL